MGPPNDPFKQMLFKFFFFLNSSSSFGASANMMRPHVMLNVTFNLIKKIRFSTPKKEKKIKINEVKKCNT